jgi:hypothetical protein
MNYQPPKALQAHSKNRAIKPAIQNTFEFDSKIPFECKHDVFGINLFPVFLSNERFVFRTRMYDVRLLYMIYSRYRHDRNSKSQESYLCDQNRTDSAQKIYQLIPERQ